MTPERIAELRALAEKATPGPWKQAPGGSVVTDDFDIVALAHRTDSNAAFIAAARTALPEALDAIERVLVNSPCRAELGKDVICSKPKNHPIHPSKPMRDQRDYEHRHMPPLWLLAALEGTQ